MNYLIYNGFWNTQPPTTVRLLEEAALKSKTTLQVYPNHAWTAAYGSETTVYGPNGYAEEGDIVLFWDKDVRLARALHEQGVKVFNLPESIALCDDKSATHMTLACAKIPQPDTLVAPMTYVEVTDAIEAFLQKAEQKFGYPMVVKECFGSLGGQVYLAKNATALREMVYSMGAKPFLIQRFMQRSAGEDWRLYVVGGCVEAAMHRFHPTDFRANLAVGGLAEKYLPTEEEQALAVQCCRVLGLTFGAVDLLRDAQGKKVVCEVNSNAFLEGITRCTGIDVASKIIKCVFG